MASLPQHDSSAEALGFSGRVARALQANAITPLLALVALLLGLFAVLVTPREEEPQINVTMANVIVPFPGSPAEDVENLVAVPFQQIAGVGLLGLTGTRDTSSNVNTFLCNPCHQTNNVFWLEVNVRIDEHQLRCVRL